MQRIEINVQTGEQQVVDLTPEEIAIAQGQTQIVLEQEAKQYQRDRATAYPTIQEQLDLLYWDKVNGTNNWQDAINAVKTEYPKP